MRPIFFFLLVLFPFISAAQHQDKVDFIRGEIVVTPEPTTKDLYGSVLYEFNVLKDVDSIFLDAKNIGLEDLRMDKNKIKYTADGKTITIRKKFKEGQRHRLEIWFYARPKQTLYCSGWNDEAEGNEQIWTQGQGKYTSHWLPSFDDMEEKVEFDLTVRAKEGFTVIANGEYVYTATERGSKIDEWHFDMLQPMSSYLLAFAIGNYKKQELKSKSGIPIENYYYPRDSLRVEPTYRHTKEIFDFLEEEIGFPYPWQNYKQVPVRDFLYAGMENTSCTIFSDGYVIDSTAFVDKNYVNVNAHELAHQWFGNLVTEKDGNHHWLHEGFATYYAQLAEKEIFGDDHYYWKLFRSLKQLQEAAERGEGQALTDPKASSLTFYEKGAWALYILQNQVGDEAFKKGIRQYLEKYQFKNATIPDFLAAMENTSGQDLSGFRKVWLENADTPFEIAKEQLRKDSESVDSHFTMDEEFQSIQSDDIDYVEYWGDANSIHLKIYMLENYGASLPEEIFAKAFTSDTIALRQSLLSGRDLPSFLDKGKLESLLQDDSYITKEKALFALWQKYPEERAKYLEQTKAIVGLPNKNVRLLWLTLAMLSDNYNSLQTKVYFDELSDYTDPKYSFEIRQGAFFYLKEAFGLNGKSLGNLVDATNHHSWQFKKFARNLLDELLVDEDYKARLNTLAVELSEEKTKYLKSKLSE